MRNVIVGMGLLVVLSLIGCGEAGNSGPAGGTAAATAKSVPAGPGVLSPANTKIEFVGTKPDGKHDGGFKTFSGSITPIHSEITAAKISIEIDTDSLYADNPKLTQHLKSLKLAGLVAERPEGRKVYYRAEPNGLAPLVDWMSHYGVFWRDRFADLRTLLKEIDP